MRVVPSEIRHTHIEGRLFVADLASPTTGHGIEVEVWDRLELVTVRHDGPRFGVGGCVD